MTTAQPTPDPRRPFPKTRRKPRFWTRGKGAVTAVPYFWLLLFFLLPFAIVLKISLAEPLIAQPPFTPLFGPDGALQATLDNYRFLWEDHLYIVAYLNSLKLAGVSTLLCLLIGYPMAYGMAKAPPALRNILLLLVILPFWTSFLLRVYAWMGILRNNGLINNLLLGLGVIDQPIQMMNTDFAIYIGITYSYLPFMILPLYAVLERLPGDLVEAAQDLGCRPWKAFATITLPLSVPGIIAGSLLVFIPAVGEFVIPSLLGGPDSLMIGRVLWDEFFGNRDWPVASAVAIALLLVLVVPIMMFQRMQLRREGA
ncbi:ABC transporter permease subunit [Aquibaculum arenosum]|uniref:ABC transporter permease subunit n=1 Tax=Aquibaculum arenosum TaxID=3032591 RepID=A0ABT5YPR4_9PROT|nr:ABC transporter permease subunit [Fodinicurvata sp. CAU 1616]MDF2096776.1 ABC transporter permease subunit [Fodinicurvata sp. CAU 1616]